jgi:hypothetical protein
MSASPIHVEITSPARFDRVQLVVRLLLGIALGWLGITTGWVVALLFIALPLIAAISVSLGTERFRDATGPAVARVLDWLLQFSAFLLLLTDRFPSLIAPSMRVDLPITARPTPGTALLRLVTSLPSGVVLMVLWFVSGVLWVVSAITVLVARMVPEQILAYQRGVLRWQARLAAYHASLVDDYPPFTLDTGADDHPPTFAASAAR